MTQESQALGTTLPVTGQLVTGLVMGGAENIAVQLANAHVQAGGEAHLIVVLVLGPLLERVDPRVNLHFLDFRRASIRNPLRFATSVVRGFRLLSKVVVDNKIEVMQTHLPDANLWGLALALFRKCRVYVTIHNNLFFGDKDQMWISRFLIRRAYLLMFRKCAGVITCSSEVRNSVLGELNVSDAIRSRVHVVANGVSPSEPLTDEDRLEIRQKWNVGHDEFFVVAGGRFAEAKNFPCLVDAIGILVRGGHYPKVMIAGDGPMREAVLGQVASLDLGDTVMVPGNLPNLLQIMQAADCLAMSSRYEGLPLVLLEGMIRGLPVAGTRIKGISEVVRDGIDGFLVESNNPAELAIAIAKLMDNRALAKSLGQSGRELVAKRHSFARVYDDLMSILTNGTTPP